MKDKTRIVIIGGGFAGTQTALELEKIYRRDRSVEITLIDSENFFTFTPLLAEVPSGSIQPKHIVFPLRALLKQTKVKQAEVKSIDLETAAAFNQRIRLEGGANVLAAAQAAGVRRYLRQSVAFFAAPGPGLADESTPLAFDASPAVAAEARVLTEIEQQLLQSPKLEGIVLRYGFFYGSGTWFHPDGDVARQVRQQQFPIVGSGAGVWSWLHIEDAAIATARAAEQGNPGIYLIANDQPLAVREWLPAFAKWLKAPPPPQLSVDDVLKATGADAVFYGTQMRGASNAKAKRELNFQPRRWSGCSTLWWLIRVNSAHSVQPAGCARRLQ